MPDGTVTLPVMWSCQYIAWITLEIVLKPTTTLTTFAITKHFGK